MALSRLYGIARIPGRAINSSDLCTSSCRTLRLVSASLSSLELQPQIRNALIFSSRWWLVGMARCLSVEQVKAGIVPVVMEIGLMFWGKGDWMTIDS